MSFSVISLVGFVSMTSVLDVPPAEDLSLEEALLNGTPEISTRLRYEDVSQKDDRGAQATTYRIKASYLTEPFYFTRAKLEGIHVGSLPDDEGFNSLANGQSDDLVISDPEQSFLSQYWLGYEVANSLLAYGRQKIAFGNERFLGVQDFRQGESSISGLTFQNESLNFLKLRAGSLYRFESPLDDQIDGGHQSIKANYFNTEYRGFIHSLFSLYYLDLDNDSGNDRWDSRTWGIRFAGDIKNEPRIEYTFEYARQSSKHDNPGDYSEAYYHIALASTYLGIRVGGGKEVLGASDSGFVVTPLGDLNRFQGWNDQFSNAGLGNISSGVEDSYASLGYVWSEDSIFSGTELHVHYHDYSANNSAGGLDSLGNEYNVELNYVLAEVPYAESLNVSLKFSDYEAKDFGVDTQKSWVEFDLVF